MKGHWRTVLTDFKATSLGRKSASLPKSEFPKQLARLIEKLKKKLKKNIQSGFRKCGIYPLNAEEVVSRLPEVDRQSETAQAPSTNPNESQDSADHPTPSESPSPGSANTSGAPGTSTESVRSALDNSLINMLSTFRYGPSTSTPTSSRRKKLAVPPGKSIKCRRLGGHSISSDSNSSSNNQDNDADNPSPTLEPEDECQPSTSKGVRPNSRNVQQKRKLSTVRQSVRQVATRNLRSSVTHDGMTHEMDERDLTRATTTEENSTEEAETEEIEDREESDNEPRARERMIFEVNVNCWPK